MSSVKIFKKDNSITIEKDDTGGLYYGSEIDIYWHDSLESVNINYRGNNTGITIYQDILDELGGQAAATYELTKDYLRDVIIPCECGNTQGTEWGDITGTLSNQIDLQNALDNKLEIIPVTSISFADSPYSAAYNQDLEVDCTNGNVIINLPTAVGNNGKLLTITKIDNSGNTIEPIAFGLEVINTSVSPLISFQWTSNIYKSNGVNISKR